MDDHSFLHSIIDWFSSHKSLILWGLFVVFCGLILGYRFAVQQTLKAEDDFFQAQNIFTQFQQTASSPNPDALMRDLDQLRDLMERHPALKPKYEGPLAQTLIIVGQPSQAQPFVEDIFERTKPDHLQLYQDYSQTTLLIAGQYRNEALQESQHLQTTLDSLKEPTHEILYLFNLIRLGILYQETRQPEKELQIWNQLESASLHMESMATVSELLKVGHASLHQYIQERRNVFLDK